MREPEADVVADGAVREQDMVLEHEPDRAGFRGRVVPGGCERLTVQQELTLLYLLEARGKSEQCALAAAGRAEEAHDFTVANRQVRAAEHGLRAKAMADLSKRYTHGTLVLLAAAYCPLAQP